MKYNFKINTCILVGNYTTKLISQIKQSDQNTQNFLLMKGFVFILANTIRTIKLGFNISVLIRNNWDDIY